MNPTAREEKKKITSPLADEKFPSWCRLPSAWSPSGKKKLHVLAAQGAKERTGLKHPGTEYAVRGKGGGDSVLVSDLAEGHGAAHK